MLLGIRSEPEKTVCTLDASLLRSKILPIADDSLVWARLKAQPTRKAPACSHDLQTTWSVAVHLPASAAILTEGPDAQGAPATLLATAASLADARVKLEPWETGTAGVLLRTDDPLEVRSMFTKGARPGLLGGN